MSCIITFSTKLFTLAIAPFLLISVGIPYEFAMVSDVHYTVPQERGARGQICTPGSAFIKRFK